MSENGSFRYPIHNDISKQQSSAVLKKIRSDESEESFTQSDWNRLKSQRPTLHDFISAASREAAASDPELRARISALMLGMVMLSDELVLDKMADDIGAIIDESVDETRIATLYDPFPEAS